MNSVIKDLTTKDQMENNREKGEGKCREGKRVSVKQKRKGIR